MDHPRVKDDYELNDALKMKLIGGSVAAIVVGIILASSGYFIDHERYFFSLHTAFMFFLTITLGAIVFVVLNYVTRTRWNIVYRRFAENLSMNIIFLGIVGVVLFFLGGHTLFHHWMEFDPSDHLLVGKEPYLNIPFFSARGIGYFVIWSLIALFTYFHSVRQDKDSDYKRTQIMQRVCTVGVILMALTISFASFDWVMSMDPHWFSTMFGVYTIAGCMLAIHAALILIKSFVHKLGYLKNTLTQEHDHDLGKYMFGFTVFWGYIAYSQFMLIWYANIPEETVWFYHRWEGSWKYLSLFLIIGKFLLPFLFLMSRHVKRIPITLTIMAVYILVTHYIDLYWQIMPVYSEHGIPVDLKGLGIDLITLVGFGLVYKGIFINSLSRKSLIPKNDPRLKSSIEFENF